MAVEFGSTHQLLELERKLSELGRQGVDKVLEAAVVKALEPLPDAVERSALAILPKRGGLNQRVAAQVVPKRQRKPHGVRVFAVGQKQMRELVRLDRGLIRHPVFADATKPRREWTWVNQAVEKKFWSRPVKQREDAIKAAARAAMDKLAGSI